MRNENRQLRRRATKTQIELSRLLKCSDDTDVPDVSIEVKSLDALQSTLVTAAEHTPNASTLENREQELQDKINELEEKLRGFDR